MHNWHSGAVQLHGDDSLNGFVSVAGRRRVGRLSLVATLLAGCLAARGAAAQDSTLGTFKTWTAMRYTESGKPACMIWSQPEKSEGKYSKRGEVFVFVTHAPADRRFDRVSFETGYTFEKGSEVTVAIKEESFTLHTDGSTAWNLDEKEDERMVKAMRLGNTMVVQGRSSRGTLTRDTYSLFGFTAAHNTINRACKRG